MIITIKGISIMYKLVMSTIPKWKHERSDIEANYQNETKTFWCVPKKEVECFNLVQKLLIKIITFWRVPEPFKSKSGRFYVVYKLWIETKTFWCVPEFFKQKRNKSKNFETKPKHFDVFHNFKTKAELFYLIWRLWNKTKTFDVFQNFLKHKRNFSI